VDVEANIDEVIRTGDQVAAASKALSDMLTRLQSDLAALGAPWGDSKDGQTFYEGYHPQEEWVLGSIDAKAQLLQAYADGFKSTAKDFKEADGG
jgi:uncharacterized protein YukE